MVRKNAIMLAGICWLTLLAFAPIAQACSTADTANIAAGEKIAQQLERRSSPGAADVRRALNTARHQCSIALYARGLAVIWQRRGAPSIGRTAQWRGIPYRGVVVTGSTVWRYNTPAALTRAARSTNPAAAVAAQRAFVAYGKRSITWSWDPARRTPDVELQLAATHILAARTATRTIAEHSLLALERGALKRQRMRTPLFDALQQAIAVHRSARTIGTASAARAAQRMSAHAANMARSAHRSGWSRIGSAWSTLAQHRRLVSLATKLAQVRGDASLTRIASSLARQLTTPPSVSYTTLPRPGFYPWPRDGAYDSDFASFAVDKPISVAASIYNTDGTVVRTLTTTAVPGHWKVQWDGAGSDGRTQQPGSYSYTVIVTDPAGNSVPVAGIGGFTILRDRTPPTITLGRIRYLSGARRRLLRIRWIVHEQVSPVLRTSVVLRRTGSTISINVPSTAARGTVTVSRRIPAGTWRATLNVVDGSGNRSTRPLGTLTLQ